MKDIKYAPVHLRSKIHGSSCPDSFYKVGAKYVKNIYSLISPEIELNEKHRCALDWGCGCGRMIQHVCQLLPKCNLYGSDVDVEAVLWCKENLSHIANFSTNDPTPPLHFSDDFFDFIYGISIFTHLTKEIENKWLEELHRVTKPGGYVLLTTHGTVYQQYLTDNQEGFLWIPESNVKNCTAEGLPSYYGSSFHSERYVYNEWSKFFRIKEYKRTMPDCKHDFILCQKK